MSLQSLLNAQTTQVASKRTSIASLCSEPSDYSFESAASSQSSAPSTCSSSSSSSSASSSRLSLPRHLPKPSTLRPVDLSTLRLDAPFADVPAQYVLDQLHQQKDALRRMSSECQVDAPADQSNLPPYLLVKLSERCKQSVAPTHILAIRFETEPGRTLLLPVHGLCYAAASPAFAQLSKGDPNSQMFANNVVSLPVLSLKAPCATTFDLLHAYLCSGDASVIFPHLLPTLPAAKRTSLDSLLAPTVESTSQRLASLPRSALLHKVDNMHSLWSNVVALGIADENLWSIMDQAWTLLFESLKAQQQ